MSKITLDEAIEYCLDTASDYDKNAWQYDEYDENEWVNKCIMQEQADNYRQIAEYLKELKKLKQYKEKQEYEVTGNIHDKE